MEELKCYGIWTFIRESEIKSKSRQFLWLCRCKCGKERLLQRHTLISGTSKGCGCKFTDDFSRFANFKKNYEIQPNGCWIWKKSIDKKGYGRIGDIRAHRYSYEKFKGEIPIGMCVCHNCPGGDNTACVNPEHLWLGTQEENIKDKGPKGRQGKGEQQGNSKLKEFEVLEIKEKLKLGISTVDLASEYKVSHGLIGHIKHGRAWKHLI